MFRNIFQTENHDIEIFSHYNFLALSHFFISVDSPSKIEVPGWKNQSCREFNGEYFYIFDIEVWRKKFSLSHPTLRIFLISSLWKVHRKLKKFEVPGRKNQCCTEFDGDHFYILDIEFERKLFSLSHPTLRFFLISSLWTVHRKLKKFEVPGRAIFTK